MKRLLLTILLVFSPLSFANQVIETIQLNHRLPTELLPEIQAFLPENATARAFNNVLIIKAERAEIENIKQLLNKLDVPPQRIEISVLRSYDALSDRQNIRLDGDVQVENGDISGHITVNSWSTQDSKNKEQAYKALGIAGKPVLILMGEDIPQHEQYLVLRHDGDLAIQSQTHFISLNNGFEALARILPNNQVIVDIHPIFSQQEKRFGSITNTRVITSVSGPVGSWLEIGQISNQQNIKKQGTTSYHSHKEKQQSIYIKVEQTH